MPPPPQHERHRAANFRAGCRLALLALALLVCLPLHGLWRLARAPSPWPPRFLGLAARACGCDWRVVGAPLPRDVLFVANHLSWLDILALGGAGHAAFVAKAEIARWPIVGWLAGLNATIYVARARRGAAAEQADALREALASGRPAALFAEGTTGDGAALLPFRASLLAAVAPPPCGRDGAIRVQPVPIDYGADAARLAWPDDEAAGANAWRVLGLAGRRRATLRFLDPLPPSGDRKAIAAAARAAIAQALGQPV